MTRSNSFLLSIKIKADEPTGISINIKALTLLLMYSMHSSSLVNIGTNASFVTDNVGVLSFYKQEKIQYAL